MYLYKMGSLCLFINHKKVVQSQDSGSWILGFGVLIFDFGVWNFDLFLNPPTHFHYNFYARLVAFLREPRMDQNPFTFLSSPAFSDLGSWPKKGRNETQ